MRYTLYEKGTILTMEGEKTAEAVLVEDGIVAAVGNERAFNPPAGTARVNLEGRVLLPAFLDAHSHFSAAANALLQAPLEECVNFEEIRQRIADFIRENQVAPGEWVVAQGYDHNALAEKRHPTLGLLDAAAPDNPLIVQHRSGHVGVVNSAAICRLSLRADTPAIAGGRIGVENGQLTGYLEENAFLHYQKQVPMATAETMLDAYRRAQEIYLSHGISTVQEGMFTKELLPLYQALLQSGLLKVDVVGYADAAAPELLKALEDYRGGYRRHFRLGGCKIFLDGSPQGRTAWMREPYAGEKDYRGYPTLTDGQVEGFLRFAAEEKLQLLAHCNGDAACAQLLAAAEGLRTAGIDLSPLRPVMIHGQLLGLDQLKSVKELGFLVSFFVAHVYHWGDIHIQNFGRERADHISPAASALAAGIPFTFHQDTPVIPPDMLETVWCAVSRRTKAGAVLKEKIGVYDALRAVTAAAAYQYFEEGSKGTITPGKRADFAVLDRNPLTVPEEELREIRVVETILAGKSVWRC